MIQTYWNTLWSFNMVIENHIFNGKIHCKWSFLIAILITSGYTFSQIIIHPKKWDPIMASLTWQVTSKRIRRGLKTFLSSPTPLDFLQRLLFALQNLQWSKQSPDNSRHPHHYTSTLICHQNQNQNHNSRYRMNIENFHHYFIIFQYMSDRSFKTSIDVFLNNEWHALIAVVFFSAAHRPGRDVAWMLEVT